MDCLVGFASSVARDLVCGALNQLRYPCCFNNFVKKLEQEKDDLIVTRDSVQKFVTHTKRQARKTSEVVDKWLQDAISDNVDQMLEEARTKKGCCFGHCPNWIWRYRVGKKLANKTVDLEKFIEEGRKYVPFDRIATLPLGTLDILSEKCINFESRQSAYKQLLDAVKSNDVAMIGLYGMGGCGKTTLAMDIRKSVEAEHLFEKVLFVPVSSTVEVRRIQEKIASSLQFEFPETEETERAQRLCSRLTQEKNILIILDDVWEKLDFGAIGIPSPEHHKGCKILITTRSEAVCTLMDCQRTIYLPILTDEEAWTLFQNKALISESTPDALKKLGRLISNECKGLPVAIAAVACSLKGKAETIWRVALNKLKNSKPINIERGLTDPYKCLQLSYDNLDTRETKSLFVLCSVFPEDFEIQVEVLTRWAIGLGVVGEAQSYEEARSEVIAAKIKLVSCCLLLDADDECVKMHDIVRDVAHIIAKDENKMIKCEEEKDVTVEHNSVRYLWCVKFPNDLDCSNLEFLCLQTKMKEFDEIFKRTGMLKVLILVNDEYRKTSLTIPFKALTNLRCLHIKGYELSDFSFLSGVKNLQSLSLQDCSLPSFAELQTDVAITQLTTLKLLELNECDIEVENFEVIMRIPLLEELYIIHSKGIWNANSEDNIEFPETFSVPKTLQRYGIVLGYRKFKHINDGDVYLHGRTLLLNHFDISNEVIKGLAKKAKDLFVGNIDGGAKNMIPDIFEIEGGGLNELNKLEILDSEELECLIDTTNNSSEVMSVFSQLHTLKMDDMENLKVIWHCVVPANGPFEKLEKLYLSDCPQLTSLFTYVVAQRLVQLKILKIKRCNELKHILTDDEKMEKSQDEFSTWHPVRIFPNLEEVKIKSCKELKHIFSGNIVGGLGQLKVLEIEECDMLDQIIGDIVPLVDQDRKEKVNEIIEEGKHPHSHSTSIPTTTVLKHNPGTLSNLARLRITHCPKLGSIFTASTTKSLTSLEELFIEDCDGLVNIVDSGEEYDTEILKAIFPNLRELSVSFCGQLKYMFGQYPLENQDYKEIHIQFSALEILSLDYLPNFVSICATNTLTVTCPSLKDFYCHKCSFPFYNGVGYLTLPTDSREPISINRKDPNWIHSHLPTLQNLSVLYSEAECIFFLNGYGMIGQRVSLRLENLLLNNLPQMTYIWVAYDNSVTLQHLTLLKVICCENLEVLFPKSVVRCLPELKEVFITECMELKQIMEEDKSNLFSTQPCFPKLERLHVEECHKLKRLSSSSNDFPNLNHLIIEGASELEEIVGCEKDTSKNYFAFSNLKEVKIINCEKLEVISPKSVVRYLPELKEVSIRRCMELKEIVEEDESNLLSTQPCFPKLESLYVEECHKLKRLSSSSNDFPNLNNLIINGASELEEIIGCEKEASQNYFAFQNLEKLEIIDCAKLGVVFPKSVLICLPKLKKVIIRKCKELRQVIEEGVEDKKLSSIVSAQPCFPKLEALHVDHCHKLKRLFCASASNELPNLHLLAINGASELEELVGCKQGKTKVELPTLKLLIFMHLSNFHQEIELQNLKNCVVHECPKLSFTSTTTLQKLCQHFPYEDFRNIGVHSWDFYDIVRFIIYEHSTMSGRNEFTSSQEIGDVGNESIKSSSTGVATDIESGGEDILALDSEVVEQDDKMNEDKAGIQVEEGLNLLHKQEEIDVVPNNNIHISSDIHARLGAYKHFVDLDNAQIALLVEAITTYPHLWNASKKFSERFQAWRLKILADMLLFLQKESVDSVIPQREKEFHKLCEEAIEVGFESSWVEEMRQRVVARDPKLGEDIAKTQIDENSKSLLDRCSCGDTVPDSQGDGPNITFEEGSNSVDKGGEIVVSNDHIVAQSNEEPEQEFVAEVSTSEIPIIATSLTNSQPVERPTPSYFYIPLRETPSNALVDTQRNSEPFLMNQKKSVGEIPQLVYQESNSEGGFPDQHALEETIEIGDVRNESIKEGSATEGAKTKSLSYGVEDISIEGGVATHIESGGMDILAQYSKVVEQDDKMNEGNAGIVKSREIQVEEGLIPLDKQEEINIVSNNNSHISPASADIRARLGAYKHFVDLDDAQIALLVEAITAYPHLWNACQQFSERFQAWRLKILADMLVFLQKESVDSFIPQREKEFHKLCKEAVEIGFESSWVEEIRQRVVARDPKLGDDIAERQIDENSKRSRCRSSSVDMVLDSQLEQRDGLKEGEIGVASNDRVVAPRNEEAEEEFVAQVSTSEIPRIVTSLTKSQPVERPTPSYLNISLRETHSNALMNQQKPLGEIVSSPGIPQIIERVVAEETITKNTNMAISSIHSESTSSQLYQTVTFQSKSHTHSAIRSSQTEAVNAKESEEHPNKIIEDIGANDMMSLFAPVVVGKEGEDNLVAKTLAELEKYLKMPLKDIVSSETNTLSLLSALNFLSNLPFRNVTVSDGIKHIIHTMHRDFPTILFSFKQGFTTADKLAELEARANEVTIKRNLYEEAQRKEVDLKEQIIRLKEEIRVCEVALSSLEEEKNECIAETVGYKTELQNVRKYESQMFEVTYKWSVLCSQYQLNRMPATNPS